MKASSRRVVTLHFESVEEAKAVAQVARFTQASTEKPPTGRLETDLERLGLYGGVRLDIDIEEETATELLAGAQRINRIVERSKLERSEVVDNLVRTLTFTGSIDPTLGAAPSDNDECEACGESYAYHHGTACPEGNTHWKPKQ